MTEPWNVDQARLIKEYDEFKAQMELKDKQIAGLQDQLKLVDNKTAEWYRDRLIIAVNKLQQIQDIMKYHDEQAVPYWAVTLHKIRDAMTTLHDFRPELDQRVIDAMKLIPDEMLLVWQAQNDVRSNLAAAEIRRRCANGLIKDDPRFSPCGYCPGPECGSKKGLGCRGPIGPDGESSRDHGTRINEQLKKGLTEGWAEAAKMGEKK